MSGIRTTSTQTSAYVLRFRPLFNGGSGYVFPCDGRGCVDLDSLTASALNNYLYARTVIGREFFLPAVEPVQH